MERDGGSLSRYSEDLLVQAEKLLRADPRRPKQVNLRRAVSSAYYGLFHFLIEEATTMIVGASPTQKPLRQLVGRGFSHTAMKEASAEFIKATPKDLLKPFWTLYGVSSSIPSRKLARQFAELQQARHRADYDLSSPFTQSEAENLVKNARAAVAEWQSLKKNQPELARFYALSLYSWNSWKAR